MTSTSDLQGPADAPPANWVDKYAPAFAVPYLRLMRADRPIGTWLLLLPCWFGMALALGTATANKRPPQWWESSTIIWYAFLFAIGSFAMRGAGCVYNDIVDRDIDAKVERTALRPIPAGHVKVRNAAIFLVVLCLIGLMVLLQFNRATILVGMASLILVAAYPFMKRITWWPQLWLGFTFNWGALVAYTAIKGAIELPVIALYAACIFWTLSYDTIYAHQDREDDAMIGVKSTARRLGKYTDTALTIFNSMLVFLLILALFLAGAREAWAFVAVIPLGLHLGWQTRTLDINDSHNCLRIFKSNRNAGFLLLLPLIFNCVLRSF